MTRIFLVGFMGAGKSSIGAALADRLDFRFVDLDEKISEKLGAPIPNIFANRGEAAFRVAERDELERLAGLHDVVVATGGGAFCDPVNRELMHGSGGVSVFLDLPWSLLRERLSRDHSERPLYGDSGRARELYQERLPEYRHALVQVPLDGSESPSEAAARVVDALQETPCAI